MTQAQVFHHRRRLTRETVNRLLRPWVYCRVCGDPLPPPRYGRNCDSCAAWSGAIVRAHESRRLRAWFGDLA